MGAAVSGHLWEGSLCLCGLPGGPCVHFQGARTSASKHGKGAPPPVPALGRPSSRRPATRSRLVTRAPVCIPRRLGRPASLWPGRAVTASLGSGMTGQYVPWASTRSGTESQEHICHHTGPPGGEVPTPNRGDERTRGADAGPAPAQRGPGSELLRPGSGAGSATYAPSLSPLHGPRAGALRSRCPSEVRSAPSLHRDPGPWGPWGPLSPRASASSGRGVDGAISAPPGRPRKAPRGGNRS